MVAAVTRVEIVGVIPSVYGLVGGTGSPGAGHN